MPSVIDRPKGKAKAKGKAAPKGKSIERTPEGEFIASWLEDATEENPLLAALLGTATKAERESYIKSCIELCEDYSEALYGPDEDDDEDEEDDDDDDYEDDDEDEDE